MSKKFPQVEDSSPIIAPHLTEQKVIPEFVARPPKTPAPKKTSPPPESEVEESPPPRKEVPAVILEQRFKTAIDKVVRWERRPEYRQIIKETGCFGRLWQDPDTEDFCDEIDCDLRQLCQLVWTSVCGGLEADEKPPKPKRSVEEVCWERRKRSSKRQKRRWAEARKWNGSTKYSRVPYQSRGRPVDTLAELFWEFINPQVLPTYWKYPDSKTREQRKEARLVFIAEYDDGAFGIQRSSYHQYFFDGCHLMRFWVNSNGGGWLDCSARLAKVIAKIGKIDLVKTPSSGYKTKFRFYRHRVYIGCAEDVDKIKEALYSLEGLVRE